MNELDDQAIVLLVRAAAWIKAPSNEDGIAYVAIVAGKNLALQMNDFPQEHLFTLLLQGQAVLNFNDWPEQFGEKPWFSGPRIA
jgi:hypothetical protein